MVSEVKHLGKVLRKLVDVREPLPDAFVDLLARLERAKAARTSASLYNCPQCRKDDALVFAKAVDCGPNFEEWRCRYCGQVVLGFREARGAAD